MLGLVYKGLGTDQVVFPKVLIRLVYLGLEPDQILVLKRCFDGFADEEGAIPADNVGGILSMMGMKVRDHGNFLKIQIDGNILNSRNGKRSKWTK